MHERISVNSLCFPDVPLALDVERCQALGVKRIGVTSAKMKAIGLDAAVRMLRQSGLKVVTIGTSSFTKPHTVDNRAAWPAARAELMKYIAVASELGAPSIYLTTGSRGSLSWEEAADAFGEAIAPCLQQAKQSGVELLLENSATYTANAQIATSLRDMATLAEHVGIGVCIDIFSMWTEAGLRQTVERVMPRCHLVQVSDYVLGDRQFPARAVPGDGAIPLPTILGWILDSGYKGTFDLELMGPRIDKEGHVEAVRRGAQWLDTFLRQRLEA